MDNRMTSQKIAFGFVAVALFAGVVTAHAADLSEGQKASRRGDYATALRIYRQLADQGNAKAQASLGFIYAKGQGVAQDYAAAVKWFRKAANQGDASAQFNLGIMYLIGQGVALDFAEAVRWYHKAANQGHARAQGELGFMYSKGFGVTQDYVQAHMWYNIAAAQGKKLTAAQIPLPGPRDYRDSLAKLMTPAQIAEAQRLAREWKSKGK